MKLLSIILSIHILLLSVVPTMAMVHASPKMEHCKKACCHSNKSKKQSAPVSQKNKGCCNNGMCNPLLNCCNGIALLVQLKRFSPYFESPDQKNLTQTKNPNSGFLSAAWHPPQIV